MKTKHRITIPDTRLNLEPNQISKLTPLSELWHKDDDYLNCELCSKEFTLFNRRHHCRNCGKVICDDCSQYYTSNRDRDPDRVCKLCYNCVLNPDGEESEDCKSYMKDANLVDDSVKQFIADDFSIDGLPVTPGSILTIKNITQGLSMYYPDDVIYEAKVDSLHADKGMIWLTLTKTNDKNLHPNDGVYLQNDNHNAYHEGNREIPSRIIIYDHLNKDSVDPTGKIVTEPITSGPSGYVFVTDVTPPAQDGGYKYRKNKSKRKNKRSLRRRRTSKRSNICRKNKKVTKRLRKSRRRRARR